jgi:hypothetical protein
MKHIFCFIFYLCFYFHISAQKFERPSSLQTRDIIFNGFSGIREKIPTMDNSVKWIYTISGKEYDIIIQHSNKSDAIFGAKIISKLLENTIKKNADYYIPNIAGFPSPNGLAYKRSKINDTISITDVRFFFCG